MFATKCQNAELAELLTRMPAVSDARALIGRVIEIMLPIVESNHSWAFDAEDAQQEGLLALYQVLVKHASGEKKLAFKASNPAAVLQTIVTYQGPRAYAVSIHAAGGMTGSTPALRAKRDAKNAVRRYVTEHGVLGVADLAHEIVEEHNAEIRGRRKEAERGGGLITLEDVRAEIRALTL